MNKKQFVTILQVALFNFNGADEKYILELNPEYPFKAVKAGIQLCNYLKSLEDFSWYIQKFIYSNAETVEKLNTEFQE